MAPKTRTKVKAGALARARKPSGRINKDDLKNALKSLDLATPGLVGAPGLIKKMFKDKSMSSDKLKANIAMLKKKFGKRKSIQSKGPVGTRLKKVSKLGK